MNAIANDSLSPQPRIVPLWQFFDDHVDAPGHSAFGPCEILSTGDRKAADFFIRALRGRKRVLDIGCGAGLPALYLAPHAQSVIGIDASANMVEAARRNAAALGLRNAGFEVVDAQELPFSRGCFDGVSLCGTLMSLDRASALLTLREARRVLRPQGCLAILECDWAAVTPCRKAEARRERMGIVVRLIERQSHPSLERETWYVLKEQSPSDIALAERLDRGTRIGMDPEAVKRLVKDAGDAWRYESTGFDEAELSASLHEAGFQSAGIRHETVWNSPILFCVAG